jgi:hypothetical protein
MFALQGGVDGADGGMFLPGLTVGIQESVRLSTGHEKILCRAVGADPMNCESRAAPEPSPYTKNKKLSHPKSSSLIYEEVIKGIGFKTNQLKRVTKRQKQAGITPAEEDSAGADSNGDMKCAEWRQAEEESACWYVPLLETIPQDCPDGVFCLVGGNFN